MRSWFFALLIAPAMRSGRELHVVDAGGLERVLDQLVAVVHVVDGEVAVEAEPVGVLPQQPRAEAVEGADPDAVARHELSRRAACISPAALFVKVMARMLLRPDALLEQIGDAAGDDARLAGARAGEDEQRPLAVRDGGPRWASVRS